MEAFKQYFWDVITKKYVNFSGRATRTQYWMFVLFQFIVSLVLGILLVLLAVLLGDTGATIGRVLQTLVALALFLPGLGITVRRLHDTTRSGWWVLLSIIPFIGPIVLLIFMLLPSTEGENKYNN